MAMQNPMSRALADAIATMLQAIRMGDATRARQMGLTALAVYCHDQDLSVDQLLSGADPSGELTPTSSEWAGIESDPVLAKDRLEVLDAPDNPPGRFMRAPRFLARYA